MSSSLYIRREAVIDEIVCRYGCDSRLQIESLTDTELLIEFAEIRGMDISDVRLSGISIDENEEEIQVVVDRIFSKKPKTQEEKDDEDYEEWWLARHLGQQSIGFHKEVYLTPVCPITRTNSVLV